METVVQILYDIILMLLEHLRKQNKCEIVKTIESNVCSFQQAEGDVWIQ
jgi:hypothetical protein